MTANEWVPASKPSPQGKPVLIHTTTGEMFVAKQIQVESQAGGRQWVTTINLVSPSGERIFTEREVTHWMHLPPSPES